MVAFTRITTFSSLFLTISAIPFSNNSLPLEKKDTQAQYISAANGGINYLQQWYSSSTGLWSGDWWNSANALTMLADYLEKFPSDVQSVTNTVFPNTLANAPKYYGYTGFLNNYYDDELWWALGWIKAYDVTGNTAYLNIASSIFEDPKSVWGKATCGGLWWDKSHTQVNAIANALYFTTAVKLANRKPSTPSSGYYYNEAVKAYNWIINSGLINSNNLLNDGLDLSTCKNNNGPTFTYNQGVILSGLVEMTWASGSDSYNQLANTIATAAISKLSNSNGILTEPCEPNSCDGDEQQFKGIFARNIQFMVNRATVLSSSQKSTYVSFLQRNADSIIAHDDSGNGLGLVWGGPVGTPTVQTQSSALDALVGAACVS